MNGQWFYNHPPLFPAERGRPGTRLVRGLMWALLMIFLISLLAFIAGQVLARHLVYHTIPI